MTSDREALRRLLDELEQPPMADLPGFPGGNEWARRRREELVARVNARAALLIADTAAGVRDDLAEVRDVLDRVEGLLERPVPDRWVPVASWGPAL